MLKTRFYTAEHEVDRKLGWFDVTRADLIEVARRTVASRADSADVDVRSMPGHLSYLYGTRHLRMLLLSRGWQIDRSENVESSVRESPPPRSFFRTSIKPARSSTVRLRFLPRVQRRTA